LGKLSLGGKEPKVWNFSNIRRGLRENLEEKRNTFSGGTAFTAAMHIHRARRVENAVHSAEFAGSVGSEVP
jgi:hypothetical protein